MNNKYFYIYGTMGMTSSGSFTRDNTRWIIFDEDDKIRIESLNGKPYGASKQGIFIDVLKYR